MERESVIAYLSSGTKVTSFWQTKIKGIRLIKVRRAVFCECNVYLLGIEKYGGSAALRKEFSRDDMLSVLSTVLTRTSRKRCWTERRSYTRMVFPFAKVLIDSKLNLFNQRQWLHTPYLNLISSFPVYRSSKMANIVRKGDLKHRITKLELLLETGWMDILRLSCLH